MNWGIDGIRQSPFHMPPLFSGSRLIVYGILPKDAKETTVTLTAKTGNEDFSFQVPLNPSQIVKGSTLVQSLAAKSLIRDLENNRSYRHTPDGQLKIGNQDQVTQEIIQLSVK